MEASAAGTAAVATAEPRTRPRVSGEREEEILQAALHVLAEGGYDRFSFDAVAAAARASKATLYRRWPSKNDLVLDAASLMMGCAAEELPNTGSLRGDLLAQACAEGGLTDELSLGVFGALIPAVHRNPQLNRAFERDLVRPKRAASRAVFVQAQERGEIGKDADLDLLASVLPGLCMHECMLTGKRPTRARIAQLVDSVVLPACAATA